MTQLPQEISYIIYVEGVEQGVLEKQKPGFFGRLGRLFGASAGGSLAATRNCAAAQVQGAFDHSTIPAVLAKLADLKQRQRDCLDDICARSGKLEGYAYSRRETAEIWVGPSSKIAGTVPQAKFYPGDAYRLAGDDITAENLGAVLMRCDSAESRATAIAQALQPPENPKLMKPLKIAKKPA